MASETMTSEKQSQLNKERAGLLSVFTRIENNIFRMLNAPDTGESQIEHELESIKDTYKKLVDKTITWKQLVSEDVDEQNKLDEYLSKVHQRLDNIKLEFDKWTTERGEVSEVKDDVKAEDSASQAKSKGGKSETSSYVAARKAALKVQAAAMNRKFQLQIKQLELKQMEEALKLETDIAAAEAEEKVLQKDKSRTSSSVTSHKTLKTTLKHYSQDAQRNTSEPHSEGFVEALRVLQLPKVELLSFDGDPLKYWTFIRSFYNSVDSAQITESTKLNCLLQYCSGKAREVIECCAVMDPSVGFDEAKRLLYERFGNQHEIAKAWIQKITAGPAVRHQDGPELRKYADAVRSCVVTLRAMDRLCEVDNQIRMKLIVERLPTYLQGRWRKTAVQVLKASGEYPNIDNLAEFIQDAADEANDPVFGLNKDQRDTKRGPVNPQRKSSSVHNFVVGTSNSQRISGRQCKCCTGTHPLYQCDAFKKMKLSDRLSCVKQNKLCFNCFSSLHMSHNCHRSSMCGVNGCGMKHSNLLHDESRIPKRFVRESVQSSSSQDKHSSNFGDHQKSVPVLQSSVHGVGGTVGSRIALPIVPVVVKSGSQQSAATYALLDPGSTNTFCTKDLADKLGLKGVNAMLSLNTLTCANRESNTKLVTMKVTDMSELHSMNLSNVIVVDHLPNLKGNFVSDNDIKKWPHLRDITLPNLNDPCVTILIGQDHPLALTPLEVRTGRENEPYATRTIYGWTINGPIQANNPSDISVHAICVDSDLQSSVERFWETEQVEANDDKLHMSKDDKYVLDLWNTSVQIEDGHYKLPIPFRDEDPDLPTNYAMAASRLESLGRKLNRNDEMKSNYTAGIHELVEKGYAERVPDDQVKSPLGPVWYIPHHVVLSEKKPGKFRIVFDCSAKFDNVSLNTKVLQGPDLANSLIGVLLRFRENKIAVSGDIESMFLQVKVADAHKDALRFLWWKDNDLTKPPEVYRMKSHLFGGVWSSSVANYAVKRTVEDFGLSYDNLTVEAVLDNFYVDDCLKSVACEQKAITLIQNVSELLHRGGFNLHKWTSNSRAVLESVPPKSRAGNLKNLDLNIDTLPQERALGVQWNTDTDELGFKNTTKNKPMTRRGMISVISSIFDPIGFIAPVILQAKKIFQDECRLSKSWDSPMEHSNEEKWSKWLAKLSCIEQFSVPRHLIPSGFDKLTSCQLHNFADASECGYGVVSYLRLEGSDQKIHCSFLLGKSRLAPLKKMTIPRLELSAAVLAVKMDTMLCSELRMKINNSRFWTDSTIVLHYIKNKSQRYKTFVANRVTQILQGSSPDDWNHVPSDINPADIVSRGQDGEEFLKSKLWIEGPAFLSCDSSDWPMQPDSLEALNDTLEIKEVKVNLVEVDKDEGCTVRLMNKYSSWYKLKRAVAWILRLKSCLLQRSRRRSSHEKMSMEPLNVSEMEIAEVEIVKYLQRCAWPKEVNCLSNNQSINRSSPIFALEPVVNPNGVLCVGGRLDNAPARDVVQHQMILPKRHHVVDLIIRETHDKLGHSGVELTLSSVREKFWIIKCRPSIKRILKGCVLCKRLYGQRSGQRMASLPEFRVSPKDPPFTHVGVDCFGPFFVKRGRSSVKRYGCVFTCMTTRAVHVEKLDTMDTNSFINALRRFEARRGKPAVIHSDNGSNFKGAERELKNAIKMWNQDQIHGYLLQKGIVWKFNPPTASHMGGIWERQIRTIRRVLSCLLCKEKGLTDESLETLFCEIENIVNSRPITVISDHHKDAEPLTPNHLLLLRSGSKLPPGIFKEQDKYTRRWKYVQHLADIFWKRWCHEYLPTIQLRQKWFNPSRNLCVGDIVLIMNENLPRNVWALGRITQTFPGKDGLVRSVEVKSRNSLLNRPVHKLCLLESVCHED